ncbi:hypothetical protein Taro_040698 [Colocasia esculenta]|uniref:APO domain-containing protein n=1 Tax=Colocasia esculenta TaxID=4460 RepID=A0A843WMM3_COLES|nr:hypothetical protein [Colocasia esculenta]
MGRSTGSQTGMDRATGSKPAWARPLGSGSDHRRRAGCGLAVFVPYPPTAGGRGLASPVPRPTATAATVEVECSAVARAAFSATQEHFAWTLCTCPFFLPLSLSLSFWFSGRERPVGQLHQTPLRCPNLPPTAHPSALLLLSPAALDPERRHLARLETSGCSTILSARFLFVFRVAFITLRKEICLGGCKKANSRRKTKGVYQRQRNSDSLKWTLHVSSDSSFIHGKDSRILRISNQNSQTATSNVFVIRCDHPQNSDLPRYYSKREKKPFPVPILELRRAARERQKSLRGKPRRPMPPPKNGMLVKSMIPVAYDVLNARIMLINNLRKLMKVVTVHACKHCNEIHVGPDGHPFRSCHGRRADFRRGLHEWTKASVEDVFVEIESYHLSDRLGRRITHEERFSIPRVPAIMELCVQAGVDLADLPTKRRRKPVIRINKSEIIDANEDDLPEPEANQYEKPILAEILDSEAVPPSTLEERVSLAEDTLQAWETLRDGAERLMKKYAVRVCGYCPEVHVGPSGHKAQNCGAFKHQQRNGQHGWQAAVLNDLIPPRYVWHVPDVGGPPLQRELSSFYGQAPAVVEICVQGGAEVPERYKPTMRLDIGIPSDIREADMVV